MGVYSKADFKKADQDPESMHTYPGGDDQREMDLEELGEEPFNDDDEYCQCGNAPIEEEEIDGRCFSCGRFFP